MHLHITNYNIYFLGRVYYYALTGSYWSHQSKIIAKDGASYALFGWSVSIYYNNSLIGAYCDDEKGTYAGMYIYYVKLLNNIYALTYNHIILLYICSGSVYYYTLTGSYWSHQSKIIAKDGASYDNFGSSVSIYDNNALIGAFNDDDVKASNSGMFSMYLGII